MASGGGFEEIGASSGQNAGSPPPFLSKTYDMVDDPTADAVVSWGAAGNSFVVWNPPEFAKDLLPKYFKHRNFSSFVRQLNTYGFRKVDPDRWEFANEGFLRGQKHLLRTINRRRQTNANAPLQKAESNNLLEVGHFGMEGEIERLKRDKNVLMQELIKLRQQQQTTDNQMQTMGKRLQGMEHRQQQMMAFLAKAMRTPRFLSQFSQKNENNRQVASANKKRRLPRQESMGDDSPHGQLVKYQPYITMMKMLGLETSPRVDTLGGGANLVSERNSCPSETFESTSSWNSGVTVAEASPNLGVPFMPASPGFSAICAASAESESHSTTDISVSNVIGTDELPDGIMSDYPMDSDPCIDIAEFPILEGIAPGGDGIDILIEEFFMPGPENLYVDMNLPCGNEAVPVEMDNFNQLDEINVFNDEDKLPIVMESLWDDLLINNPLSGDTEEADSSVQNVKETKQLPAYGWNSARTMEHLTEKMGLLSSDSQRS